MCYWFHCDFIYILGSVLEMTSDNIFVVDVSVIYFLNIWGVLLNFVTWFNLDLVLYLCVPFLALLMSLFYCCFPSGITWGIGSDVSAFMISNIIFGNFSLFGVTVKCWLLIGWKKNHIFCLVHWLDLIWVCLYNRHPKMFFISDWFWLRCTFHLGYFLVKLFEFLLAYLPDWHPRRYFWGVCFSEYIG